MTLSLLNHFVDDDDDEFGSFIPDKLGLTGTVKIRPGMGKFLESSIAMPMLPSHVPSQRLRITF